MADATQQFPQLPPTPGKFVSMRLSSPSASANPSPTGAENATWAPRPCQHWDPWRFPGLPILVARFGVGFQGCNFRKRMILKCQSVNCPLSPPSLVHLCVINPFPLSSQSSHQILICKWHDNRLAGPPNKTNMKPLLTKSCIYFHPKNSISLYLLFNFVHVFLFGSMFLLLGGYGQTWGTILAPQDDSSESSLALWLASRPSVCRPFLRICVWCWKGLEG